MPGSLGFGLDEFADRWNASPDADDELRIESRLWEVAHYTGGGSIGEYSFSGRFPFPRGRYLKTRINEDGTLRSVRLSYESRWRGLREAEESKARLTTASAPYVLVEALTPSLSADERNHLLEELWGADPGGTDSPGSDAVTAAADMRFRLFDQGSGGIALIGRPDNLGNGTLDPSLAVVLLLKLHIPSDDIEWDPGYGVVLPQDSLNLWPVDFVLEALHKGRTDATAVWRYGSADGKQVEIGAFVVDGVAADDVLAAAVQEWSGSGQTPAATQLSIGVHDVVWMLDTGRVMYLYESNGVVHWVASASRSLAESVMENMP